MERITQLLHHLGPENNLQVLVVNVNNPQKMLSWHFNGCAYKMPSCLNHNICMCACIYVGSLQLHFMFFSFRIAVVVAVVVFVVELIGFCYWWCYKRNIHEHIRPDHVNKYSEQLFYRQDSQQVTLRYSW